MRRLIQFTYPGVERSVPAHGNLDWNHEGHARTFMLGHGRDASAPNATANEALHFWGEWEARGSELGGQAGCGSEAGAAELDAQSFESAVLAGGAGGGPVADRGGPADVGEVRLVAHRATGWRVDEVHADGF